MCKRVFALVLSIAALVWVGAALGADITWTDGDGANSSWCTSGNWNPAQVPGTSDTAIIDATSPDRGPIVGVGCNVDVQFIHGPNPAPGHTQVMDVNTSGTVRVSGDDLDEGPWNCTGALGTSIINISGSPTISIDGGDWRGTDDGLSILNISGSPTITTIRDVRGADGSGTWILNMSGGTINAVRILFGDNGGGELNMSGGTMNLSGGVELGGMRGSAPITVNMTGGTINMAGAFGCPSNAARAGAVEVYLWGGLMDCHEFSHGTHGTPTDEWLMDIREGTLKIDDDVRATIQDDVDNGRITAYGSDGTVVIDYVGGETIVTALPPEPNYARSPNPADGKTGVDPNSVLRWTAGINAASQDIFFGTNGDDVEAGVGDTFKGNVVPAIEEYNPGSLDYLTTYYWRIDAVNGPETWTGKVWEFKTRGIIEDPNLVVWYKLDEESGQKAYDSSGWGRDGGLFGPEGLWMPTGGYYDGARRFEDDLGIPATVIDAPMDTCATVDEGITVAMWLKDAYRGDSNNVVFNTGYGGETGAYHVLASVGNPNEPAVIWRAGNDTNDVLTWDMSPYDPDTLGGWHHWAFVKDEVGGKIAIYFDGKPAASDNTVNQTLVNIQNCTFKIGSLTWENMEYIGKMDDFRVYDYAFSDKQVASLFVGGELELAYSPIPFRGESDVSPAAVLSWNASGYAAQHDVYLGTDRDAVDNATTASTGIYRGGQTRDDVDYDPPGDLELDTDYYWRIDEVNEPNVWKGKIWEFKTRDYIVLDDFESYDDAANDLYWFYGGNWLDGIDNGTGSTLYLGIDPDPTHGGAQSLMYLYQNSFSYYSEGERVINTGERDWTAEGVKILTLFFYGDPGNDIGSTEQMYVGIKDGGGTYADVAYGDGVGEDMSDVQEAEWHEWSVPLKDFTNVILSNVTNFYILFGESGSSTPGGTGTVYFDDIRLTLPRCEPLLGKPAYDLSGNCIVDVEDVAIMAESWLLTDAFLPVDPPDSGPVGWWKLDGNANDSSGHGAHGTAQGTYSWITGHIDGAIEFGGIGGKILVPDSSLHRPANEITVMAWVKSAELGRYSTRIVAKGLDAGDRENFALQVNDSDTVGWFVRDATTGMRACPSSKKLGRDEWWHIAGTYDGASVNSYVNGQLDGTRAHGAFTLLQDPNSLAIGDSVDAYRAFFGRIDDVRLYNTALSAEEVAYVATQSTGGAGTAYMPLLVRANIYDNEPQGSKAVNFKDFAELMTTWLEEKLWPTD